MKFVIEPKDIKEVKWIAKDYYGILLTDQQARELINSSASIRSELTTNSLSDTAARTYIADAVIEKVMKGKPSNPDKYEEGWFWPLYGSTKAYTEEFKREFKKACHEKGIKLTDNWAEDW